MHNEAQGDCPQLLLFSVSIDDCETEIFSVNIFFISSIKNSVLTFGLTRLSRIFLPDPRGAGLHQAFQFSYFQTDLPTFVSLDKILVPTHSLTDKGTKGQRDKGTKGKGVKGAKGQRNKGIKGQKDKGKEGQRDKGTKDLWNFGTLKLWNFGTWELENLGTWELGLGNLGTWKLDNLGPWELGNLLILELWNLGTSRDKINVQPLGTKTITQPLGTKKHHATLRTKKITQPLGTK